MTGKSNSTLSKLVASSGILLFGLIFQLGFGFISRIAVGRIFGSEIYGGISIGYVLLTSTSILAVVGLNQGVGRYLPRNDSPEWERGIILSAYQIVVPISIGVGIAVALSADLLATLVFKDPTLTPILRIFGITIPFAAFVRLTIGCIRGMKQSLPRVSIENIFIPLSRLVLILIAAFIGFRALGIAWAYAISYGIAAVLCLVYLVRHTAILGDAQPRSMHRVLLSFSLPLVLTAAMNLVLESADVFILGMFDSTSAVGVYNVAYPISKFLITVLMAFAFIFMPVISELHADNKLEEMRRTYQLISKWILFATLPLFLVFAFFPTTIIRYTFGSEYLSGGTTLTVLSIGFLVHALLGLNGNALQSIGNVRTIMYDNMFVAILNVGLNLVLIPQYSFLGAAIATTICYVILNSLLSYQLYRETKIHPLRRESFVPAGATLLIWALLFFGLQSFFDTLSIFFIELCVFIVLYPIMVLRLGGVEQEDIDLINTLEQRAGINLGPIRRLARQATP
ncbi:flippase [Haladaptatus sp. NG-WS-4]